MVIYSAGTYSMYIFTYYGFETLDVSCKKTTKLKWHQNSILVVVQRDGRVYPEAFVELGVDLHIQFVDFTARILQLHQYDVTVI